MPDPSPRPAPPRGPKLGRGPGHNAPRTLVVPFFSKNGRKRRPQWFAMVNGAKKALPVYDRNNVAGAQAALDRILADLRPAALPEKVRVRCLGPRDEEHFFMSADPRGERVCPDCRRRQDALSARAENPICTEGAGAL